MSKKTGRTQRFLRWLFGSPFQDESTLLGDPVPPELRAFEARSAEITHQRHSQLNPRTIRKSRHQPS